MTPRPTVTRRSCVIVFVAVCIIGLSWAVYTAHAWEDYYITYRASKNLATGHGLTFTVGERVHSFTSPLGVLLPALASLLTGHRSDAAALWIYRLMSLAALGGAGVFLWRLAHARFIHRAAAGLLATFFAFDTKIIDFSTNGMETGLLLLFLAWTLFALLTDPPRRFVHLGLAWAGLMWTRPDSFIYIGALAIGAFLFLPPEAPPGSRRKIFKAYVGAGAITTALYLPWLFWSWAYYGSPIPHTVTAKGLFHPATTAASLGKAVISFPATIATHRDILTTTFMPPYSFNTGWPALALQVSFWVSVFVMVAWLLPGIRREARVTSFAFGAGQFYLSNYVGFPVPWYLPTVTLFALVVIASLADQAAGWGQGGFASPALRRIASATGKIVLFATGALLAGALFIFALAGRQLRWQQAVIEHGQRREIGLWLRSQAKDEHETVFLEPLGYIGFYSQLKMLDYPGLCSPEVVAARRRAGSRSYPDCWPEIILDLLPNWIVLRSYEADAIRRLSPEIFARFYTLARTFDVRPQIAAIPGIAGRGYLTNDAYFEVYHRNELLARNGTRIRGLRTVNARTLEVSEGWGQPPYDSGPNLIAHAPSRLVVKKPRGAHALSGGFGIFEGAYADPKNATDGAEFMVTLIAENGTRRELLRRALNPRYVAADRGKQSFSVELPISAAGSIELAISPGPSGSNAFDWTYWSQLLFEFRHVR